MLEIGDGARARYGLGIGLSSLSLSRSRSLSLSLSRSPPIVIGIAMGVDPEEAGLGAGEVESGKGWSAGDEEAFGFLRGLRAAPAGLFLLIGVRIAARVGWAFDYKGVMPAFTYRMISVNTC